MVARRRPRDFNALERRRKQAARLFAKGETVLASVARQVKASRQSVCRWYHDWTKGGAKALKAAGRAGRKSRLSATQVRKVEAALLKGAKAHGFSAELWTLPRVATVIERVTGVKFHPVMCGRFLDPSTGQFRSRHNRPRNGAREKWRTGSRSDGRS